MLLWILENKFSCSHIFIFPGDITRSRVAGSNSNSILVPWRTSGLFSKIMHHVSFPPAANEFPILPQPHWQFPSLRLTDILAKYEAILTVDFPFPSWLRILSIFSCACGPFIYPYSGRNAYSYPLPICQLGYLSFYYGAKEFFIYSKYKSLIRYMICKHLLPDCGLSFHFLNATLLRHRSFQFGWSPNCLFFLLVSYAFAAGSKKPLHSLTTCTCALVFVSKSLLVLTLSFKSWLSELIFFIWPCHF